MSIIKKIDDNLKNIIETLLEREKKNPIKFSHIWNRICHVDDDKPL